MTPDRTGKVVVVDAVRTPFGRRRGALADVHPADLLAATLRALMTRTGVDPGAVGHVVGGCIDQVGEQAMNITRTAWLAAGHPEHVAATTVDSQCGSSQQALTLGAGLIAGGLLDLVVACGVESMTRVPLQAALEGPGHPVPPSYVERYGELVLQFAASERIAAMWGITREDADAYGLRSQNRARRAWDRGEYDGHVVAIGTHRRDEGLRATSLEALAALQTLQPDGVHTAGTASQISDGASAVLLSSPTTARQMGLPVLARVVDTLIIGSDPTLMLTGPIPATRLILERNSLGVEDIDRFEVNEAFAAVVLAWQREIRPDPDRVNPGGGSIAMGHPLGATGTALVGRAVHGLHHDDQELALVTVCCGGGLATATLLQRTT